MAEETAKSAGDIEIEVAYAKPGEQAVVTLKVQQGATVAEAITLSGLLQRFPEISPADVKAGIFGAVCRPDQVLKAGDRVEIYRPLIHDPKESRRQRALNRK